MESARNLFYRLFRKPYNEGWKEGFKAAEEIYKNRQHHLEDEWFVHPRDIITVSQTGQIYIGRDEISLNELKSIQEEIKYLDKTRIWEILQGTLKQKAIEKSVINSSNWEQVLAGKMMIHSLGVFKSIIDVLKLKKTS